MPSEDRQTLDDALADRAALSAGLVEVVREPAAEVGIEALEASVKDLMLPGELRRAATETLLARERGELERARGESAALRSLLNVARLLDEQPALLHLRTLQAASEPGSTIVLKPGTMEPAPARQATADRNGPVTS